MPGGVGTLEELFEVFTWAQLGFHQKPIGLLNVDGFYDGLLQFIQHMVSQRFLKGEQAEILIAAAQGEELLQRFQSFVPHLVPKWLDRDTI
jgi:uncharacterized protein (TIGR00730 family)